MQEIAYTIAQALAPICFCIFLGWMAGKLKLMPLEYSKALARYVVLFALPIALFVAAAKSNPRDIFDGKTILALLIGFGLTYLIGWFAGHTFFRHTEPEAALQGLACSFPNIAYCGPPVLIAAIGNSGLLMVVTGNLVVTLVIVPITLVILARSATDDAHKIGIGTALLNAVKQPLVFLPIGGACLAALGVGLPSLLTSAAEEIGVSAGGAALFALGLTLSGLALRLNTEIAFNVLVKNVLQPFLLLGAGWVLGLRGPLLAQVFLLGVLPTATEVSAIAVTRNFYKDTVASSTLASAIASIFTISIGVVLALSLRN
jgi:malonate transporter and related proteins